MKVVFINTMVAEFIKDDNEVSVIYLNIVGEDLVSISDGSSMDAMKYKDMMEVLANYMDEGERRYINAWYEDAKKSLINSGVVGK